MKRIPVGKFKHALVDDEDFWVLAEYRWNATAAGFSGNAQPRYIAMRTIPGQNRAESMHRVLMNAPEDLEVDHIDGNPLNNQRDNLRLCTRSENNCNKPARKNSKSGLKGVHKYEDGRPKPWAAEIGKDKRRYKLGHFATKEEAAAAYAEASMKLHGEFSRIKPFAA